MKWTSSRNLRCLYGTKGEIQITLEEIDEDVWQAHYVQTLPDGTTDQWSLEPFEDDVIESLYLAEKHLTERP